MVNGEAATHPVLTGAALAAELSRLGIRFVEAAGEERPSPAPTPKQLLMALASIREARLRMALIPLFLSRPDYAAHVVAVAGELDAEARVTLVCYYTAAALLQRKYASELSTHAFDNALLPDHFCRELGLPPGEDVDAALHALGARHTRLSGRPVNWVGTYEQALNRFLTRVEAEAEWAKS